MNIRFIAIAGLVGALGLFSLSASHAEGDSMSIASLNQNKATLSGKSIQASGKVVKVNNGIMGRNFIHIQDGTGDANSNNLIVTSKQTAKVGDQISITGTVVLNRDFGSGYMYPLLIEDSSLTTKN